MRRRPAGRLPPTASSRARAALRRLHPHGRPTAWKAWTAPCTPPRSRSNCSCGATPASQSDALADACDAAITGANQAIVGRSTAYDGELDLEATVLTVEWWDLIFSTPARAGFSLLRKEDHECP
jgi:hypothetical protein